MPLFVIRATETWTIGNILGGIVLLIAVVALILYAVRVTADRYDRPE